MPLTSLRYWQRACQENPFCLCVLQQTPAAATVYALVTIFFVWLIPLVIHRLFFSPLSKVPGPRFTALTGLWLMYHEFSRSRRLWLHELHLRYGPVVRISPDEVSFASRDALKEIYTSGGSGYDKTPLYNLFQNFQTPNMFSTQDKNSHSEFRRCFADRYTKSFVIQSELVSGIEKNAEQFVENCANPELGTSVDIYVPLHCYALDCVSYNLFNPFGTRSLMGQPSDIQIMKSLTYYDSLKSYYFKHHFPRLSSVILPLWRANNRRKTGAPPAYVLETTRRTDVESHTLLYKLQHQHLRKMDPLTVASECMDHLAAGIDTTSNLLCFLLHRLSLPEAETIQEELCRELAEAPSAPLDNLQYLDAVVKEGLRIFATVPMSLPRKVPSGGRVIDGFYMPEGAIVSCQAYTLHRLNTDVFPEPESFIPERWLVREGELERNQLFFTFAAGGRGCIGKHIALLELKILLRTLYTQYRTRVAADMKASMEFHDQVIAMRPKDQSCLITFEKI